MTLSHASRQPIGLTPTIAQRLAEIDKRLRELDYRMSVPPINWKTMTDATREQTDLRRELEELQDAAKVLAGVQ
jgi:hypothetical protein